MTRQPGDSVYDQDPETGLPRSYGAWETPVSEPAREPAAPPDGTRRAGQLTVRHADQLRERFPGMPRETAQRLTDEADLYYQAGAPETLGQFIAEVCDPITGSLETGAAYKIIRQDDGTYLVRDRPGRARQLTKITR